MHFTTWMCFRYAYRELFPESRCLFMYRDVLAVSKSLYRLTNVLPAYRLLHVVGRFSTRTIERVCSSMGLDGSNLCDQADTDITIGVLVWMACTHAYLEMRRGGTDIIRALRYEDLVAKPLEMCR